jgi:hypothetical protein
LHADILDLEDAMRRLGTGSQSLLDVARPAVSEPPPSVQPDDNAVPKPMIN